MSVSLKKRKLDERVAEPLNQKIRRVLERMGDGNNGDEIIRNCIIKDPMAVLRISASLEPKNVHVKQDHRINFVRVPPKQALPETIESNIVDITPIAD